MITTYFTPFKRLCRYFLLSLLLFLPTGGAWGQGVPGETEDNPLVIDLSATITPVEGYYKKEGDYIVLTRKGAFYKLAGAKYDLFVQVNVDDPGTGDPITLLLEAGSRHELSCFHVENHSLVVKQTAASPDEKVRLKLDGHTGPSIVVKSGASLDIRGPMSLECLGYIEAEGSLTWENEVVIGYLSTYFGLHNSYVTSWSLAGDALLSDITVKDESGNTVYASTFPSGGYMDFALFSSDPEVTYTLWQGDMQMWGKPSGQDTYTTRFTRGEYTEVSPASLDLKGIASGLTLTCAAGNTWTYTPEGGGEATRFSGEVVNTQDPSSPFKHPLRVCLEAGEAELDARLSLAADIEVSGGTDAALTILKSGANAATLTLTPGKDIVKVAGETGISIGQDVTLKVPAVGKGDKIFLSFGASGQAVKLGDGAKAEGLRAFTYAEGEGSDKDSLELKNDPAESLPLVACRSFATNFSSECAIYKAFDKMGNRLYYRGRADDGSGDGTYVTTFPEGSYVGLEPYTLVPSGAGSSISIDSDHDDGFADIRWIGNESESVINELTVKVNMGEAPRELVLSNLVIKDGLKIERGAVNLTLEGNNEFNTMEIGIATVTLSTTPGATLGREITVINNGAFTDNTGLVRSVGGFLPLEITEDFKVSVDADGKPLVSVKAKAKSTQMLTGKCMRLKGDTWTEVGTFKPVAEPASERAFTKASDNDEADGTVVETTLEAILTDADALPAGIYRCEITVEGTYDRLTTLTGSFFYSSFLALYDLTEPVTLTHHDGQWTYACGSLKDIPFNGTVETEDPERQQMYSHSTVPVTIELSDTEAELVLRGRIYIYPTDGSTTPPALTVKRKEGVDGDVSFRLRTPENDYSYLVGETALRVGKGVTCHIENYLQLFATGESVVVEEGAHLTGLRSFTFEEPVAEIGFDEGDGGYSFSVGGYYEDENDPYLFSSFASSEKWENTMTVWVNDVRYQGKPSTASSEGDPYVAEFPPFANSSDYVAYTGMVPCVEPGLDPDPDPAPDPDPDPDPSPDNPTGVSEVRTSDVRAFVSDGRLYIYSPVPVGVRVYHFGGGLLRAFRAPAGDSSTRAPEGPCIVVVGERRFKIGG